MPAPTGSVDGTSIDVDFSSLRLDASFLGFDIPLWIMSMPLDMGVYDPNTGGFGLIWTTQIGSGSRLVIGFRFAWISGCCCQAQSSLVLQNDFNNGILVG